MHKNCLVCKSAHQTLYWHLHVNDGKKVVRVYCCKCARLYTAKQYADAANISIDDIFSELTDEDFQDKSKEITSVSLPSSFISLFDPRAKEGRDYLKKRGIEIFPDLMYDTYRNGIAQIIYRGETIVGSQIRLITPTQDQPKMMSIKGTQRSLALWGWNGNEFLLNKVKVIFLTEGVFDALSIKLAFKGDVTVKSFATLGCNVSKEQLELIKTIRDKGIKVICAFDSDEAGIKGRKFLLKNHAIDGYIDNENQEDWNSLLIQNQDIQSILRKGFRDVVNTEPTKLKVSKFKPTKRFAE